MFDGFLALGRISITNLLPRFAGGFVEIPGTLLRLWHVSVLV